MKKRTRLYVGVTGLTSSFRIFRSAYEPTAATHGREFAMVIGPFRTRRGAEFMERYGRANPHCQTVADAERLAREAQEGAEEVQAEQRHHARIESA